MSLSRRSLLKWLGVGVGTLALPIPSSPVPEPARAIQMPPMGWHGDMVICDDVVKVWERTLEYEIRKKDPLFDM